MPVHLEELPAEKALPEIEDITCSRIRGTPRGGGNGGRERKQVMRRRRFLAGLGTASLALPFLAPSRGGGGASRSGRDPGGTVTLFLAGDVMTGRGIDQVLPHSVPPDLFEPYVSDARVYVRLAEEESGAIPAPISYDYVWGEALDELERVAPGARIINLETAVTDASQPWPEKGVHYRMHPENAPLLTAAGLHVCVLGNNHVLDWGREGLRETLRVVRGLGLEAPGAGVDRADARRPGVLPLGEQRLLVFSYGMPNAGVPPGWAAEPGQEGVNLLSRLDDAHADAVIRDVDHVRMEGDRVVVSIHWGPNWGYDVPDSQRSFAHRLVDSGLVDVIHGHSSHHPKGVEVYRGRPILYGAGDFLNDYEGIQGHARFRGELTLMYFPELAPSGELVTFRMTPMRIHRFRLRHASKEEAGWLRETLDRHSRSFGTRVREGEEGRLELVWD